LDGEEKQYPKPPTSRGELALFWGPCSCHGKRKGKEKRRKKRERKGDSFMRAKLS
jgi:ribonuclease I